MPCIASGYPNPTIRWLKDGRPLPTDSRWTRRLTGLTVSDLRLEDSGNYICEVTNSFGSKEVTSHLSVIGKQEAGGTVGGIGRKSLFSHSGGSGGICHSSSEDSD